MYLLRRNYINCTLLIIKAIKTKTIIQPVCAMRRRSLELENLMRKKINPICISV